VPTIDEQRAEYARRRAERERAEEGDELAGIRDRWDALMGEEEEADDDGITTITPPGLRPGNLPRLGGRLGERIGPGLILPTSPANGVPPNGVPPNGVPVNGVPVNGNGTTEEVEPTWPAWARVGIVLGSAVAAFFVGREFI